MAMKNIDLGVIAISIVVTAIIAIAVNLAKPSRNTLCYFTRHDASEIGDKRAAPWAPFHLYRSDYSGATNEEACANGKWDLHGCATPMDFRTRDEAWEFMQRWQLEACK